MDDLSGQRFGARGDRDVVREKELAPGQTCQIPLVFQPPDTGDPDTDSRDYSDEIVIHQNIPSPDTGTRVILTGTTVPS